MKMGKGCHGCTEVSNAAANYLADDDRVARYFLFCSLPSSRNASGGTTSQGKEVVQCSKKTKKRIKQVKYIIVMELFNIYIA